MGDGRVGGKVKEFTTKPGDTVLYSKFGLGATEVDVGGREYILIREVRPLRLSSAGSPLTVPAAHNSVLQWRSLTLLTLSQPHAQAMTVSCRCCADSLVHVCCQDDLIGVLPHSGATAADVPELRPLSDRVLIQVLHCRLRVARPL